MPKFSSGNYKIPLSLDLSFQIIWTSLIWIFLFMSIFSASTYQSLNWITVICVCITVALYLLKKKTYITLNAKNIQFNYFMGLKKECFILDDITKIVLTKENRTIEMISKKGQTMYLFHLTKKNKNKFTHAIKNISESILIISNKEKKLEDVQL